MPQVHHERLSAQRSESPNRPLIGFIVPDLANIYYSDAARHISECIRIHGFGLVISSSNNDQQLEKQLTEQMILHRVDALIVASCQRDLENLQRLGKAIPLILFDRRFEESEANFVGPNYLMVGMMAAEHLIQNGFRRIAYIGGPAAATRRSELEGYRIALSRHGIVVPETYILGRVAFHDSDQHAGRRAMERLLKLTPHPDAVFCSNDSIAVGAMNAILDAGLRIPKDIALVGVGNASFAESLRISLSSIDVSCEALAVLAGHLAVRLSGKRRSRHRRSILLSPKLIARDSTIGP